ncbi:hypothetical protein GCM10008018_50820 [Paenibacillus marchantiophytorum]|uniref:NlpC/P60 domain-containing protein n=1 Tax=Paenibacillus marchantiophytorum TaxID=1619310 RepID=A0ABQ1F3K8_9BACL|nr:C40 family peptidase [Paenibacillus marchantiophytorum]GFZ98400.1 hypothetical protein GCM10008018_50820 [Paenibacillus marchantiophytorum]
MPKIMICLGLSCLLAIVAGCSHPSRVHQQSVQEPAKLTTERQTDNRMSNWNLTIKDAELYTGDLGIGLPAKAPQTKSQEVGGQPSSITSNSATMMQVFPDTSVVPKSGGIVENVIDTAMTYLGTAYEYGSNRADPSTFDCSDFTHWAYLYALGMDLPTDSRGQAAYVETFSGRKYTDVQLAQRGDLLFFISYRGNTAADYAGLDASQKVITHTGIYLGDGKIIHTASQKTGGVRIDQIFDNHLQYRFVVGGSVLE